MSYDFDQVTYFDGQGRRVELFWDPIRQPAEVTKQMDGDMSTQITVRIGPPGALTVTPKLARAEMKRIAREEGAQTVGEVEGL